MPKHVGLRETWARTDRLYQAKLEDDWRNDAEAYGFNDFDAWRNSEYGKRSHEDFMEKHGDIVYPQLEQIRANEERARQAAIRSGASLDEHVPWDRLHGELEGFVDEARFHPNPGAFAEERIVEIAADAAPEAFTQAYLDGKISEDAWNRQSTRQVTEPRRSREEADLDASSADAIDAELKRRAKGGPYANYNDHLRK